MRVLLIGQLPKEVGGKYTTGAAKVVYELSKQHVDGLSLFTFATNTPDDRARKNCSYSNQYIGFKKNILSVLLDVLGHPLRTWKEWRHYIRVDHQNALRYAFYKTSIVRAIKLTNPDLIHVNSISNVSPAKFATEGKTIPLLLTCHGVFYNGDIHDVKGREIYQGNLPLCDYFTGLTNESRYELTSLLGVSPCKYTIIPNGVDTTKFYYSEEWRNRIRQEMNVSTNTIVFITVASLQQRKGQLVFLKMLEQLNINYQYWLIGLGPDKEIIEAYVHNNHLESKVKLLGYQNSDDLFKYYSASDIYAHPSWKEGQALSEIEAYTTGLRAIVNKAVARTLVDNADNRQQYLVIDFDNIRPSMIIDWIMTKEINRASRSNYDWKNILERYFEVYKTMIS